MPGGKLTIKKQSSIKDRQAQKRELLDLVQKMRKLIPELEVLQPQQVKSIRAIAAVRNEFLSAAAEAVNSSPKLQNMAAFDADEAIDTLNFTVAMEEVAADVEDVLKLIRDTIAARRARVAQGAMQVYDLSKGLVRNPEDAGLEHHIHQMKNALGRGSTNRKRAAPKPPAAPAQ